MVQNHSNTPKLQPTAGRPCASSSPSLRSTSASAWAALSPQKRSKSRAGKGHSALIPPGQFQCDNENRTSMPRQQCSPMQQSSLNLIKAGTLLAVLGLVLIGCSAGPEPDVYSPELRVRYLSGGRPFCEGADPSPDLALFDTLHFLRAGAQLALSYDFAARTFTGTLENTTEAPLRGVGVEVHLSNGTKLEPDQTRLTWIRVKPWPSPSRHPFKPSSCGPHAQKSADFWNPNTNQTRLQFATTQESRMR